MHNFIVRTLSAIVYAVLVIGSIIMQPICFGGHPLLFGVLFMIISTLAVREFHVLSGADIRQQSLAMIANVLLFSTLYFLFKFLIFFLHLRFTQIVAQIILSTSQNAFG